jgi:hypothetical protein
MEQLYYISFISDINTPIEGLDQLTHEEAINWIVQNGDIMLHTIQSHS